MADANRKCVWHETVTFNIYQNATYIGGVLCITVCIVYRLYTINRVYTVGHNPQRQAHIIQYNMQHGHIEHRRERINSTGINVLMMHSLF